VEATPPPLLLTTINSTTAMSATSFIVAVPLLAIVAIAAFMDLRSRRIPNVLSLGGAVFGLAINGVAFGTSGVLLAAAGWVLCLACFLPFYVSGGTAAGDVKLMAAVGAFLGPANGLIACVLALVAGASLGSLCLVWRNVVAPRLAETRLQAHAQVLDKIPYAAAIALGAVATVLQPAWVAHLLK